MKPFFFSLLLWLAVSTAAQTGDALPFKIQLPRGYRHKRLPGIDTTTGEISKRHGLRIEYDLNDLPVAQPLKYPPPGEWNRQCKLTRQDDPSAVADDEITCVIDVEEDSHKEKLSVHFPDGTSFWARVKNKRQIAEMLRIVLTYDPRK